MKRLKQIFKECGTDKFRPHRYDVAYEFFLSRHRKKDPFRILEIGVLNGASLKAWREYFEHPEIYCIDIKNKTTAAAGTTFYRGDSSNRTFLRHVVNESGGNFDLIIDDGGHCMHEQQVALQTLWPAVTPNGLYVVEDLASSYRARQYNPKNWPSTITILEDMVERNLRSNKGRVKPMFCFHQKACFIWKPREVRDGGLYPGDDERD